MSTETASITTLTATVRQLHVGNRQVTKTIYSQLDSVSIPSLSDYVCHQVWGALEVVSTNHSTRPRGYAFVRPDQSVILRIFDGRIVGCPGDGRGGNEYDITDIASPHVEGWKAGANAMFTPFGRVRVGRDVGQTAYVDYVGSDRDGNLSKVALDTGSSAILWPGMPLIVLGGR